MKTYIVAGVPRAGKSTTRQIMLEKHKITGLSVDLLRKGLQNGIPELGICETQEDSIKSKMLWPYLKGILHARTEFEDDLVIEGRSFIPEYLKEFNNKPNLGIVFLGYTTIDPEAKLAQLRNTRSYDHNWTDNRSDEELLWRIKNWIEESKSLSRDCEKYGIKYFDTSFELEKTIEEVISFLLKDKA